MDERQTLAHALTTAESPANRALPAHQGGSAVFRFIPILQLDPQPNGRQPKSLGTILEHAVNALLQLEYLRINHHDAQENPNNSIQEAVTVYRQKTLVLIQALVNDKSLELGRSQAGAGTAALAPSSVLKPERRRHSTRPGHRRLA